MRVLDIDVMKKIKERMSGYHERHDPERYQDGEKWIQEALPHIKKGALTKQAKREHESPLEFAKGVLAHPEKYTERTRKRAQFLVNIQGKKKK